MTHRLSYERRATRLKPRLFSVGIFIGVLIILVIVLRMILPSYPFRQAMFLSGGTYQIASFSEDRHHVTVALLSPDMDIPAVFGYGRYTIASVERLDHLDAKHGMLMTRSIANAFGLPVSWYVNVPEGISKDPVTRLRALFSWSSIPDMLLHRIDTSMSVLDWISYVFAVQSLAADQVQSIDMTQAITPVSMPDGSTVSQLDESKLDYLFGQSFIDSAIRSEGHSVAVYNTTAILGVAQRASRIMAHMGIQLVFVGNSESPTNDCKLHGTNDVLRSKTAAFIRAYFQCKNDTGSTTLGSDAGADLVVELGRDYAQMYK